MEIVNAARTGSNLYGPFSADLLKAHRGVTNHAIRIGQKRWGQTDPWCKLPTGQAASCCAMEAFRRLLQAITRGRLWASCSRWLQQPS